MRRIDRKINNKEGIEAIIKKADVCRIALVDGELPYIVTLNFGYKSGTPAVLYFHCANTGRKLDIIEKNNTACFQMDVDHELVETKKACGYTMNFKSIVGYGKIYKVTDKNEKIEGLNYLMKQYSERTDFTYEEKMLEITTILKLEIDELTAKHKK
jgi:nitroimidazol reductase NimA-like FMN-containing flavoprotein (pyridoxamine 5'-phosphate oxidase superfamily)